MLPFHRQFVYFSVVENPHRRQSYTFEVMFDFPIDYLVDTYFENELSIHSFDGRLLNLPVVIRVVFVANVDIQELENTTKNAIVIA